MTAGPAGKPSSAGLGTFGLLWPHALPSLFLRAGGGASATRSAGTLGCEVGPGPAEELGWGCR